MKWLLAVCSAILLLSSCAQPEKKDISLNEVKIAIAEGNARYIQANEKGDAQMLAELFTEDGLMVHPNVEPIRGRDHIRSEVARLMSKSRFTDWELNSISISASGNLAYELMQYGFTLRPEGKNPIGLTGKYIIIWRQQNDGSWKIQMLVAQPND